MKRSLYVILAVSLFGLAFSGTLTYQEVLRTAPVVRPSPGAPVSILGYPAGVYGFFMYLIIAATALVGLVAGRRPARSFGGAGQRFDQSSFPRIPT